MELTASKLLGGTYGIAAIVTSLVGVLIGFVLVFTSALAGVGIFAASAILFLAGLLSFGSVRGLFDRVGLTISGGAAGVLVAGLSIVAVLVFSISLGGGLLTAASMADTADTNAGPTGPGSDVSNVSTTSDDLAPSGPDAELDVTWNARAQSAVDPDPDDMTSYGADDGQKYIVVRMQVENTGDSEVDLSQMLFRLDTGGVIHDPQVLFGSPNGLDVALQPGASHEGYVAFQVPAETTEATLLADQDSYYGATLAVSFDHDSGLAVEMDD